MANVTIWFGAGLFVLGVVGYVGAGAQHPTALIPSAVGAILLVLGLVGRSEDRRALMMHIAAVIALVGFLGSAMGLAELPALLRGDDLDRPWAVGVQSVMAVVLAAYLALAVRSFVAARRGGSSSATA